MKIAVNTQKCQGHTLCTLAAPDVFDLHDEDGHAIVKVKDGLVPSSLHSSAERAITTCPEQAISWVSDDAPAG
jgi:ferredoxin